MTSPDVGPWLAATLRATLRGDTAPPPPSWDSESWRDALSIARHHGVANYLSTIAETGASVPEPVRGELAADRAATIRENLATQRELLAASDALRSANVRAMLLKGLALTERLYPAPGLRAAGDIDLLVAPGDAMRAAEALQSLGYRPEHTATAASFSQARLDIDYECSFSPGSDSSARQTIDLHWAVAPWYMGFRATFDEIWEGRETWSLAGTEVAVPGRADLAWYLCVHGTRHLWCRWIWLLDVAILLQNLSPQELADIDDIARRRGNPRFVTEGLRLANTHIGAGMARKPGFGGKTLERIASKCLLQTHRRPSNNVDYPLCHALLLERGSARIDCARQLAANVVRRMVG